MAGVVVDCCDAWEDLKVGKKTISEKRINEDF